MKLGYEHGKQKKWLRITLFTFLTLFLCVGVSGDWIRPNDGAGASSLSNLCRINIQSSYMNMVDYDITPAEADIVNVHCDFVDKKVFGGDVN